MAFSVAIRPEPTTEDALAVLVADQVVPLDRHPVAVYLAGLALGSRRTQRAALRTIASLVSPAATELTLPWHLLDYAHTSAIRAKLAERFAPATANRMLAAMRGVLRRRSSSDSSTPTG